MICLELLGMSRAGKTTQKNNLIRTLQEEGAKVLTIERPKVPFSEFKSAYRFHEFLIGYICRKIEQGQENDFVVLDRGLYDRQVLLDFDLAYSAISQREHALLSTDLKQGLPSIDYGFVFMVSPEESVRRWETQIKQGLDYSHLNKGLNTGDDIPGLYELHNRYSSLLKKHSLEVIDGTNPVGDNLQKILRRVANAQTR